MLGFSNEQFTFLALLPSWENDRKYDWTELHTLSILPQSFCNAKFLSN